MAPLHRRLAQGLLFLVSLSYLWLCPHSKVEESFGLQAVHDLFYHGLTPALQHNTLFDHNHNSSLLLLPYDHLQYPGVVPRSFAGPAILSTACHALRWLFLPTGLDLLDDNYALWVQFLARACLLSAVCHGWYRMAAALDQRGRSVAGTWLLLVTATQFHLPYYSSRMLPNVFATVTCLHAYAAWLRGNLRSAAVWVIVSTAVFRCDVLLLLFTAGLSWIFWGTETKRLGILEALWLGVATGVVTLALTVPLDSLLWQRPLWPEGEVLFFNTILNKSSEWGISAWHFYFTSALPKAMALTIFFVPLAVLRIPEWLVALENRFMSSGSGFLVPLLDTTWLPILVPALGYVALYSFLGHKETRFLFPVLPLFNLAAALGLERLYRMVYPDTIKKDSTPPPRRLVRLALWGCGAALGMTLASSLCFVAISRSNYPGGDALQALSQHVAREITTRYDENQPSSSPDNVNVYIDVASAMSGVSLFGQRAAAAVTSQSLVDKWSFSKAGYEEEHAILGDDSSSPYSQFTHLLTEDATLGGNGFSTLAAIPGYPRLNWRRGRIETNDAIFIRQRNGWLVS